MSWHNIDLSSPSPRGRHLGVKRLRRLAHPSLTLFLKPVTLPPNVDEGGVMEQTIEERGGQHLIGKEVAPLTERCVTAQNDSAFFLALGHQLAIAGDHAQGFLHIV